MPIWTRDAIMALSEADLRTKVLIPLFRAMGYRDVMEYHGGALEQGKDIVMWREDLIHGRLNYAVVAKSDRITGEAATGKGTAGTVVVQVQQCFGAPYQDPITDAQRAVDRVFVISSQEIKKEAETAIRSALRGARRSDHVEVIGIATLWDWIQEHMPRAVVADLAHASSVLADVDPDVAVSARLHGGSVEWTIQPKPGASPALFPVGFSFPATPEGDKAAARFRQHIRTGARVEIDGKFVSVFRSTELLRTIFPSGHPEKVTLSSVPPIGPPQLRIRIELEGYGAPTLLEGLEFKLQHAGTEQATLNNLHQDLPWRLDLDLRRDGLFTLTWRLRARRYPIHRALQFVRLQDALAREGVIRVFNEDTGVKFAEQRFSGGMIPPSPEGLLELVETLRRIQERTHTIIELPAGDIDYESFRHILWVDRSLTEGRRKGHYSHMTSTLGRGGFEQLLEAAQRGSAVRMVLVRDETERVLDTEVDLGPVVTMPGELRLTQQTLERLRDALLSNVEELTIEWERVEVEQFLLRFMSDGDRAALTDRVRSIAPKLVLPHADRKSGNDTVRESA